MGPPSFSFVRGFNAPAPQSMWPRSRQRPRRRQNSPSSRSPSSRVDTPIQPPRWTGLGPRSALRQQLGRAAVPAAREARARRRNLRRNPAARAAAARPPRSTPRASRPASRAGSRPSRPRDPPRGSRGSRLSRPASCLARGIRALSSRSPNRSPPEVGQAIRVEISASARSSIGARRGPARVFSSRGERRPERGRRGRARLAETRHFCRPRDSPPRPSRRAAARRRERRARTRRVLAFGVSGAGRARAPRAPGPGPSRRLADPRVHGSRASRARLHLRDPRVRARAAAVAAAIFSCASRSARRASARTAAPSPGRATRRASAENALRTTISFVFVAFDAFVEVARASRVASRSSFGSSPDASARR